MVTNSKYSLLTRVCLKPKTAINNSYLSNNTKDSQTL